MGRWKALLKGKGTTVVRSRSLIPLPKVTDAALDEFEKKIGVPLPLSYRSFIKLFGPGELAWKYRIYAPGDPRLNPFVEIASYNQSIAKDLAKPGFKNWKDLPRLKRMIFFCRTDEAEWIGWDTEDVRDRKKHEYGIYTTTRHREVKELADSFEDFILNVCLSKSNLNIPGWDVEELGPRNIFDPAGDISGDDTDPSYPKPPPKRRGRKKKRGRSGKSR
jgi:hypothetical protein